MKQHKKIIELNNHKDEDFEGYILHPENAIEDPEINKRMKKHNPGTEITEPVKDNSHKVINISRPAIGRNDDQ